MSPGDTVILSGRGDLGITRAIRKHLDGPVVIVKITKSGLYQVQAPDGSLWSVPKRNLDPLVRESVLEERPAHRPHDEPRAPGGTRNEA